MGAQIEGEAGGQLSKLSCLYNTSTIVNFLLELGCCHDVKVSAAYIRMQASGEHLPGPRLHFNVPRGHS